MAPMRWGGWKLVSSARSGGSSFAAPVLPVPTLIQSVTSACNPNGLIGGTEAGNNFKFTLPNSVLAGNCLVFQFSIPNGITITSISDTVNGTWPAATHLLN